MHTNTGLRQTKRESSYPLRLLIAIDQLVNTLLGGQPDETISAKLWRLRNKQPYTSLRYLVDKIFWFDPNHCEESYYSEVNKKYLPSEYAKEEK